jgi:1,4-alpha-glucan branching enzyme
VVAQAARQGLALVRLDEALERHAPREIEHGALGVSSWGEGRDLSTWDGPAVAELAFATRAAELRAVAAGAGYEAVRQLLALQSSDWAFLSTRGSAGDYPGQRAAAHGRALTEALAQVGSPRHGIHNIAPHATVAPLLEP